MEKKRTDNGIAKKPFYKKWWFWVIILVVIGAIFGNSGNKGEDKNNTSSTTVEKEEGQSLEETGDAMASGKADTETVEGEEAIRKAVEDVVGEENLETFNYAPENNFSLIKFRGAENLSKDLTVKGMYMDMFNILKAIQPIIDTDVDLNVVYPLQDKYGNSSDMIVIKATYKNDTIQKINYDKALWDNIPELADEWWNHDAVGLSE